jgi:hypothetical protein
MQFIVLVNEREENKALIVTAGRESPMNTEFGISVQLLKVMLKLW